MDDDLSLPLFPSEAQIARAVMGDRARDWKSKAKFYEDKHPDFPRINQLMGGRYWPAVKLWFDRQNGVGGLADSQAFAGPEPRIRIAPIFKPDGKEDFESLRGPRRKKL